MTESPWRRVAAGASLVRTEDDEGQERRDLGPALSQTQAQIRSLWYPGDDIIALEECEGGSLRMAAQLCDALHGDGIVQGLGDLRSFGLVRLPVSFEGDEDAKKALEGLPGKPATGEFWRMCPLAELARIVWWGVFLGAGFGYIHLAEDGHETLQAIDPQHILYQRIPGKGRQFYLIDDLGQRHDITWGDGRWVAYFPYGVDRFWMHGIWRACAFHWLAKNEAYLQRLAWGRRRADGFIWITAPRDYSTKRERDGMLASIVGPIMQIVHVVTTDWTAELIESNGQGYQVWRQGGEDADKQIAVAISGNTVVAFGNSGFNSGDIYAAITKDRIIANAMILAETVHYQILEPWAERNGFIAPWAIWDGIQPEAKKTKAEAIKITGEALQLGNAALAPYGKRIKVEPITEELGVDVEPIGGDGQGQQADVTIAGLPIRIDVKENGSRSGRSPNGTEWTSRLIGAHYGEILGSKSRDGEPVDVYLRPSTPEDWRGIAFVLDQLKADGSFDEFKVFLGFESVEEVLATYLQNVPRPELVGSVHSIPAVLLSEFLGADRSSRSITTEASAKASVAIADTEAAAGDEPGEDHAAALAREMTEHGLSACEHGRKNRCPLCGVERVRGVVPGENGEPHGWRLGWRPIDRMEAA